MSLRASSLQALNTLAINREIDSKYDAVLAVKDKLPEIEIVANADLTQMAIDIQEIMDFTDITVITGPEGTDASWDKDNKVLQVPRGDTGAGEKGDTGEQGPRGFDGPAGLDGISVHHLRATSTTDFEGDFGTPGEKDTYTFYGDAGESIYLGHFSVTNGYADSIGNYGFMYKSIYDANNSGVVDNSERLGGVLAADVQASITAKLPLAGGVVTGNVDFPSVSFSGHGITNWNADETTLDIDLGTATLQVGQETLVKVRAGTAITNGKVVMATGSLGNSGRIVVSHHDGTRLNGRRILGVATQDIAANSDGFATAFGKVRGINTTGSSVGETWVDGDILYVKPNDSGNLTKVKPVVGELMMPVAMVVKAHSNGTLFVRVTGIDENATLDLVVNKTSDTGSAKIPVGTTAQRDSVATDGYLRYNVDTVRYEGYINNTWQSVGSGQLLGNNVTKAVQFQAQSTNEDLVIPIGTNAFAVDSLVIEDNGSLTIENGSTFKII